MLLQSMFISTAQSYLLMSYEPKDSDHKKISKKNIYAVGTVLAIFMSVPGIIAFVVAWKVGGNMFTALIISAIVYFISMGFSVKISRKMKVVSED